MLGPRPAGRDGHRDGGPGTTSQRDLKFSESLSQSEPIRARGRHHVRVTVAGTGVLAPQAGTVVTTVRVAILSHVT